ncbi:MAG: xylosidase, partial [Bacteroidota bacterium]|nr:xylosidase [Bacteroidota bacterium]
MKNILHYSILLLSILFGATIVQSQSKTYCNPLNIDYAYAAIPNAIEQGKHRATADPVITLFKGKYFLFSTNQYGYWWSEDMLKWKFVSRSFLKSYHKVMDDLCAPATVVIGDTLFLIGSTVEKNF